ncbi:MAG TPA: SMC-Scp complex subunit ScpB [Planctomycetota bacterium]|jgi:segregation and condensation protein B|nr:SMC-Scp complex subunit ScpB [Planctomycetota bacterium]
MGTNEGDVAVVDEASEEAAGESPEAELSEDAFLRAVAALVFASPEPITERKLASLLAAEVARVGGALTALEARLASSGLPLELRSIAGGWQILTTPDTSAVVQRLFQERKAERISPAALETLAVVAYRQPVTKAEIEAIRGVQVGPILRNLVDRALVKVIGRADVPGHPLQYGTTKTFLDKFGLAGLGDLPRDSELTR